VGDWADQNGRKRTCKLFCITYASSCLLMLIPFLPVLLLGRILGGLSTSILFSCFESWLISASSSHAHAVSQLELSSIMGRATTMNGLSAAAAGMASNYMVKKTSNYLAPFMASAVVLGLAWICIESRWEENYGVAGGPKNIDPQLTRLWRAWGIVRRDPALLTILLTQTLFEGSMYLFVFLWVPSLQEVTHFLGDTDKIPLGYIFSSFMISMMLGSFVYTSIISYPPPPSPSSLSSSSQTSRHSRESSLSITNAGQDDSLSLHAKLAALVCATASLTFALASSSQKASTRFWAFCLFEACVGIYYPVMGVLRGKLVPDEVRATLYSLFRLPLNAFVTISLLTGTGHTDSRRAVWVGCSTALIGASLALGRMVWSKNGLKARDRSGSAGSRDA